jgi:hypothetical protein
MDYQFDHRGDLLMIPDANDSEEIKSLLADPEKHGYGSPVSLEKAWLVEPGGSGDGPQNNGEINMEQNTQKIASGKPSEAQAVDRSLEPIVRPPIGCRFGFHKYGRWGEPFKIDGARFTYEWQQRTCLNCGLVDERTV